MFTVRALSRPNGRSELDVTPLPHRRRQGYLGSDPRQYLGVGYELWAPRHRYLSIVSS